MNRKQSPKLQILTAVFFSACFAPLSLTAQATMDGLFSGAQGQTQQQQQQQDQQPVTPQQQDVYPSASTMQIGPRTLSQQDPTVQNQQTQSQYLNQQNMRPQQAPPSELTGFQRLVAASVGKVLPIYGASLFSDVPSTFAPVDRVPVTPEYAIGPGDELLVHIWGQVNLDGRFTVDRTGNVYLPQIGAVHVAGIPFAQLTSYMKSQIGHNFRNFDLNVNIGQLRSIQVFVVGNAKRPGSYTVSSLSTLVNALFASGGPTPMGSLRNIQVRRGNTVVTTFDMYDLILRGDVRDGQTVAVDEGDGKLSLKVA